MTRQTFSRVCFSHFSYFSSCHDYLEQEKLENDRIASTSEEEKSAKWEWREKSFVCLIWKQRREINRKRRQRRSEIASREETTKLFFALLWWTLFASADLITISPPQQHSAISILFIQLSSLPFPFLPPSSRWKMIFIRKVLLLHHLGAPNGSRVGWKKIRFFLAIARANKQRRCVGKTHQGHDLMGNC